MTVKQLSIFVENKAGRLSAITRLLADNNIDIRAMSLAETKEFGFLRIIVNEPDRALDVFQKNDFLVKITRVLAIGIPDVPGGLASVMEELYANSIDVDYMYAFISKIKDKAFVILKVTDNKNAIKALQSKGFDVLCGSDIYNM